MHRPLQSLAPVVVCASLACAGSLGAATHDAERTERVIYLFQGGTDGSLPSAGLVADATGALYGTTTNGGLVGGSTCGGVGCGTVFKLTPSGHGYTKRILYVFQGGADGIYPDAALIFDKSGALYGTTSESGVGSGLGTVFKLTPSGSGYTESVLYFFQGRSDGGIPEGGVIVDATGALYGTTAIGGLPGGPECAGAGCGTVFKLTPNQGGYAFSVIHSFHGDDGAAPWAGLTADKLGALYGTTVRGGRHRAGTKTGGTVFKLTPTRAGYEESVLYAFKRDGSDGYLPFAGVIFDESGALYGTTRAGGNVSSSCDLGDSFRGCGTVFKLTPTPSGYSESVLYRFLGGCRGFGTA